MAKEVELVARPVLSVQTRVSAYDRVSGGLGAAVVISGFVMGLLLVVWFGRLTPPRTAPDSLIMFATEASSPFDFEDDVAEPEALDFLGLHSAEMVDAIARVDVVSTVQAVDAGGAPAARWIGRDRRKLPSDPQDPDPKHPDPIKIDPPAAPRWQISFAVDTLEAYASLLDNVGAELAAVEKNGNGVAYVQSFSNEPKVWSGEKQSERRIYFVQATPQMQQWDLELLRQAGVEELDERIPLHFYSLELINRLYAMEAKQVEEDGKAFGAIESTRFRIIEKSVGYDVELIAITYKKQSSKK